MKHHPTPHSIIFPLLLIAAALPAALAAETVKNSRSKMGSRFDITVVATDPAAAERAIAAAWAEIDRIEALISSWREDSETSAVNRAAGQQPVAVSDELFGLVRRALKISELSDGAFDITFASLGRLWDFRAEQPVLPDPAELERRLADVDWRQVELDPAAKTIRLGRAGSRIGFGAIGKGYAANRAVFILREQGIRHGVVSAGGDLVAFGKRENGRPWSIGISDPRQPDKVFASLDLSDTAVVTSGDYESFIEIDGKRYAHILDPRTGWPVEHLRSVTVVCPDAELADALATTVFVLGPDKGLALIDRLRGIEGMLVTPSGEILTSSGFDSKRLTMESSH